MPSNTDRENERKLRVAYEALDECNKLHDLTGRDKVPLDEVADNLAITKEEIQNSFDYLVQHGVIGDDGDRDFMNYSGDLLELIEQLILELIKQKEKEDKEDIEDEKEEVQVQYIE